MKFNKALFRVELFGDDREITIYLEDSLPQFESQVEYDDDGWDELPDVDFEGKYWSIYARQLLDKHMVIVSTSDGTEYAMPFDVDVLWELDAYKKVKEFAVWYNDNVSTFDPQIVEDAMIAWRSR